MSHLPSHSVAGPTKSLRRLMVFSWFFAVMIGVVESFSPAWSVPRSRNLLSQNPFRRWVRFQARKAGGFGSTRSSSSSPKKKKSPQKKKQQQQQRTTSIRDVTASVEPGLNDPMVYRTEYQEPPFWITHVSLNFDIVDDEGHDVQVTSNMTLQPNLIVDAQPFWVLDGDGSILQLQKVVLFTKMEEEDGTWVERELQPGVDYERHSDALHISSELLLHAMQEQDNNNNNNNNNNSTIMLQTVVELSDIASRPPLSGLYQPRQRPGDDRSTRLLLTQCEPTGFRQITYFADRPDNTAIFTVRVEASTQAFPFLLSNGPCVEAGIVDDNNSDNDDPNQKRHYAIFHDPHPKPSYLFCLVAASRRLPYLEDVYTTQSGRSVTLRLYTTESSATHVLPRLQFALETLKKCMAWDDETYGLEYDLDIYNIVASQHFALGAMENKGLNIFQTSLIATDPQCTTDVTYDVVEKTVAHEYLHNWSGNRVTLRDWWFEFGLKEGLTVYRDQEFTRGTPGARIEAVKILRQKQFSSPTALRPDATRAASQHSLDDLASSTTYHKGAEVCRMYKVLLGEEGFRKGLRLYMERHDGTGATCDDFRIAMADANEVDLEQFALWYSTVGTPTVSYQSSYDPEQHVFSLTLMQRVECDPNVLLHIPVAVGLLEKESGLEVQPTMTLELKERTQTFDFPNLPNDVVPSILRDFSAPVILVRDEGTEDGIHNMDENLGFLATYDTDGFNKWEAIQSLYAKCIFEMLENGLSNSKDDGGNSELLESVFRAFQCTMQDESLDPGSKSYLLNLPTEAILSRQLEIENPIGVHLARRELGIRIRDRFLRELKDTYDHVTASIPEGPAKIDTESRAIRALRNVILDFLCHIRSDDDKGLATAANVAIRHLETATCLTDRLAAFRILSSLSGTKVADETREKATELFYQFAKEQAQDPMVMNKWFQTQALSNLPHVLDRVKALTQHADFQATNAGRFRALVTSFTMNANAFHNDSGEGYAFITTILLQIDRISPQLASELAQKMAPWRRHDSQRSGQMQSQLRRIAATPQISPLLSQTVNNAF